MTANHDPILRALRDGDEACPDGRALVTLGQYARLAAIPPQPVDLVASVRAACATLGDADTQDADLIDEYYDGEAAASAADPGLRRLSELVREAAMLEREPDLLPRLEGKFGRLSSRRAVAADIDGATRWRIWTAVIVGHVAAFLALAIFNVRMSGNIDDGPRVLEVTRLYQMDTSLIGQDGIPGSIELPMTWSDLAGQPQRLMVLRSSQELRDLARQRYGMEASAGTVQAGVAWLLHHQQSESGVIGQLTGRTDRDLAVQSLAALALLGEGVDDPTRKEALGRLVDWLAVQAPKATQTDATVDGLVALALVEAAVLLQRTDLQPLCEQVLQAAANDPGIDQARSGSLVVAAEMAALQQWTVPAELRAAAVQHTDLGVSTFLSQIEHGQHASMQGVSQIIDEPLAADANARLDLLSWIAPTLAVRQTGGLLWAAWAEDLQGLVLPAFSYTLDSQAWLPAERVRHAGVAGPAADTFATSLAIIVLQSPYRYLPLAR